MLKYKQHGRWQHIYSGSYKDKNINEATHGKYLFFSNDRGSLIQIAETEIKHNGFYWAKVVDEPQTPSSGYVLCLYWNDDSRLDELKERYHDKIKWKSDEDTRNGKYSEGYSTYDLMGSVPFDIKDRQLYEDYYRTWFHDNRHDEKYDFDKIFDEVVDEICVNFPEEYLAKMPQFDLSVISIKNNHRKVYIEDLVEAYKNSKER
ncbi:hypothetical protein IAQ67_16090 [Paenibacillus peoriae]|uniref:Uncharacterized protein n=1 Tax=Paenibacillus peoriae TaxID=59893 RepID=A0A7H0Y2V6_9BACL|nr:hypothetical protein [Paenibacillus peoriae]QNR65414.1 hypothetical protein IAQ67_16090 [Paenibacillus peoriae]